MRTILVSFAFAIAAAGVASGQTVLQVQPISAPTPAFPEEARNETYGESVRMTIDVDKSGKVKAVRAFGPLTPCSNLKDPAVEAIRKAAIAAAKETVFAPVLEKGKPTDATLTIAYPLRPKKTSEGTGKIVSGGVLNGKALSLPRPNLPSSAIMNRVTGAVAVEIWIGEDGSVLSAGAVSGHPVLIPAAVEAACLARFEPVTLSGQRVKVRGVLTYNFQY
jgi:TonB family protein